MQTTASKREGFSFLYKEEASSAGIRRIKAVLDI
jgi:hypothetical protein